MDTGVLYLATGSQFVREARHSADSVRNVMPDIPIAIATDTDIDPKNSFDRVITLENPEYGFVDQIDALRRTPFNRTLCLDTDIYMDNSASGVFDLLEEFDIAAAHNHDRNAFDVSGVTECFPEYNTGVIAYRNTNQFQQFLENWLDNYWSLKQDGNTQNQPSFRKTLYESDLRIATLPPEYNLMIRYPGHAVGDVKMFHGRLLDIDTLGAEQYFDIHEAVEKINSMEEHRVFTQLGGMSVHSNRESNPINRIRMGIQRYGFSEACRRGIRKVINYNKK